MTWMCISDVLQETPFTHESAATRVAWYYLVNGRMFLVITVRLGYMTALEKGQRLINKVFGCFEYCEFYAIKERRNFGNSIKRISNYKSSKSTFRGVYKCCL